MRCPAIGSSSALHLAHLTLARNERQCSVHSYGRLCQVDQPLPFQLAVVG